MLSRYGDAISAPVMATFGAGTGRIVLDDVQCTGSEDSLLNCTHAGIGNSNCGHNEDAGVVCGLNGMLVNTHLALQWRI